MAVNGEAMLLASHGAAPSMGLASAVLLLLCIAVLVIRHLLPQKGKQVSVVLPVIPVQEEVRDTRPKISLLYGTQTGTAERFAKTLRTEISRQYSDNVLIQLQNLEKFSPEDLQAQQLVIFVVATYGDGEPTDDAANFYSWLTKSAEEDNDQLLSVRKISLPALKLYPCDWTTMKC